MAPCGCLEGGDAASGVVVAGGALIGMLIGPAEGVNAMQAGEQVQAQP